MKAIKSLNILLLLIPVLLGLGSCKHDLVDLSVPNENVRPAADFAKNNYDLSLFSAAIEKAGMTDLLNGKGPFTVLAPNNAAFNEIGILSPSDFNKMSPDELKGLVQRHILNEEVTMTSMPGNGVDVRYPTLGGTSVYASVAGYPTDQPTQSIGKLYFNGSYALRNDVRLTNGVLQLLDKVMKVNQNTTVQTWLTQRPQYSIFVTALKRFGYWEQLSGKGPFTVFAPANKAFEDQGLTADVVSKMDPDRYYGDRLFGSYVLKNKHFFLSDLLIFSYTSRITPYLYLLENDPWVLTITSIEGGNKQRVTGLSFRTARFQPYENVDPGTAVNTAALTDNLVDNGVVHEVARLMVLPASTFK